MEKYGNYWDAIKRRTKTVLCLLAVLVAQFSLTGCPDDDYEVEALLSVTPENLQLNGSGEGILNITSNTTWGVSTTASWLSFSTMSGVGNGQVTVRAIGSSTSDRTATVTMSGGGISRQVVVAQLPPPVRKGTFDNPYSASEANALAASLQANDSTDFYYVKGYISEIKEVSPTYGNATYYIADTSSGANALFVYRGRYLEDKKFTSVSQIKKGDEVMLYARLTNYRGSSPETKEGSCYIYSLNGKTEGGGDTPTPQPSGEAQGSGTKDDPYNTIAAINYVHSLGTNVSDKGVYIKGKVSSIKQQYGTNYGNATFGISDDGTATGEFTVYRALYLGNQKYTAGDLLKEGDDVIVYGKVINYRGNTPETVQGSAYLYSLNGKTGGSGSTVTSLSNGDFETWADGLPTGWKSASTVSSATLAQSTDAHGGSYSVNVNGEEGSNVRLATQEITLAAGIYVFTFYAKATTVDKTQVRPGHVPVTDGKVGNYAYGNYADVNNSGWTQVSHEFTLDTETTVCLIIMNPKKSDYSSGKDILIDDAMMYDSSK